MGETAAVQLIIEIENGGVDPGGGTSGPGSGARIHHASEIGVDTDFKPIRPDDFPEFSGNMEIIKWQDTAHFRIYEKYLRIIAVFSHWKHADLVE
tara:strand:+ start:50766 stop:51050 length:285 start_codon:yes stop_codon:yes gene_type:complete